MKGLALGFALALSMAAAVPSDALGAGLAGKWKHASESMKFKVTEWGEACGPRPSDAKRRPGKHFAVTEEGGKILFKRRRRKFGSHTCLSENPEIKFRSHDAGSGTTVCSTAPNDPRSEKGRYTLKADGPNKLTYTGRTSYDWSLTGTRCKATLREKHRFTRVDPIPEEVAAPAAQPEPAPADPVVAEAAKLAVRPRRGRKGKADKGGSWFLDLEGGSGSGGSASGFGLSDEQHQVGTSSTRRGATLAAAIVIGSVAIGLFGAVLLLGRRSRRRRSRSRSGRGGGGSAGGSGSASGPGGPGGFPREGSGGGGMKASDRVDLGAEHMSCPKCRREFDRGPTFCSFDAERLKAVDTGAVLPGRHVESHALICTTCRREYDLGTDRCEDDDGELLPIVGRKRRRGDDSLGASHRAKICPSCEERYSKEATYCGVDGEELVSLN
jgi:hypothetical protein